MTLGTSLIGTGCLQVYQRTVIATGTKVPDTLAWLGTGLTCGGPERAPALRAGRRADHLHAAPHRLRPPALRRRRQRARHPDRRRPLLAGDPRALRRLGAARGVAGLLYVGLIKAPSLSLADPLLLPSVAAAVIGGTSIFGGRGGYTGTILGALILTVLTTLLTLLQMPEGSRRMLFGAIVLLVTAAYLRIIEER